MSATVRYVVGDVEYDVTLDKSPTLEMMLKKPEKASVLLTAVQKTAEEEVEKARRRIPGLTDKSLLTRYEGTEQWFDASLYSIELADKKYDKLRKRLFKQNEVLYNYFICCALCFADQSIDLTNCKQ
jgi:hypothetical protein